jgi:hypothetical protein
MSGGEGDQRDDGREAQTLAHVSSLSSNSCFLPWTANGAMSRFPPNAASEASPVAKC